MEPPHAKNAGKLVTTMTPKCSIWARAAKYKKRKEGPSPKLLPATNAKVPTPQTESSADEIEINKEDVVGDADEIREKESESVVTSESNGARGGKEWRRVKRVR